MPTVGSQEDSKPSNSRPGAFFLKLLAFAALFFWGVLWTSRNYDAPLSSLLVNLGWNWDSAELMSGFILWVLPGMAVVLFLEIITRRARSTRRKKVG